MVMRQGLDAALTAARGAGFLPVEETCQGTELHYNFFESLLSGQGRIV